MIVSDIFTSPRPPGAKPAFASSRESAARVAADWLCLAAAPVFAIMAMLTAPSGGQHLMLCAAMPDAPPLGGMTAMYLLMSVFHLPPWLKLIFGR